MGERQSAWGVQLLSSERDFFSGRWVVRFVALLYSAYLFFEPAYGRTLTVWLGFTTFYAAFLVVYYLVGQLTGRRQAAAFAFFFVIAFAYYPLNPGGFAIFVYPFATLCLFLHRLRTLFLVLVAMMAAVAVETRLLGRGFETAESVLLCCVILGLSNFAFARQSRTNALLEQANAEIARLTQEAERERIARDLHDLLGHTLTAIAVKLDLARRLLPHDVERARNEVVEAEQTTRNALAEVREAVAGYRAEGLEAEIGRARRSLLDVEVQLVTSLAQLPLSSSQVTVLCLALREAVTNIVRHAHATEARVVLEEKAGTIHFVVEDNGMGGVIREGNGLRGMRERVQSMAGTVAVAVSENKGTRVEIALPESSEPASVSGGAP
jgi:two-component system, NarL family, sensor histidine kinase DesK